MEHSMLTWIQIPAKNLSRAAKFYEEVFNANFFFEELNGIPHAVFKVNTEGKKLLHGALIKVKDEIQMGLGPILFFDATGRFEDIINLITANGGKIIKGKTLIVTKESENSYRIPDTYIDNKPGYYAHFLDCEGNRLALYGTN